MFVQSMTSDLLDLQSGECNFSLERGPLADSIWRNHKSARQSMVYLLGRKRMQEVQVHTSVAVNKNICLDDRRYMEIKWLRIAPIIDAR
jgi:hypothetical protein